MRPPCKLARRAGAEICPCNWRHTSVPALPPNVLTSAANGEARACPGTPGPKAKESARLVDLFFSRDVSAEPRNLQLYSIAGIAEESAEGRCCMCSIGLLDEHAEGHYVLKWKAPSSYIRNTSSSGTTSCPYSVSFQDLLMLSTRWDKKEDKAS